MMICISKILFVSGFVLMIGAAGASDLDMIGIEQIIVRVIIAAALMLAGWLIQRRKSHHDSALYR